MRQKRSIMQSPHPPSRPLGVLIVALALVGLLTVVFIVTGQPRLTPLVQLAAMPYLMAVVLAAVTVVGLWRRVWLPAICVGLVVALVGTVGWWTTPRVEAPPSAAGETVKILTANLSAGQGTDAVVAIMQEHEPDLVFLVECTQLCAQAMSTPDRRQQWPYRVLRPRPGPAGAAILSRFPLQSGIDTESTAPAAVRLAMPAAVLTVDGAVIPIRAAHPFPPLPTQVGTWAADLADLRDWVQGWPDGPMIVAGDFNATSQHRAFRDIVGAGRLVDAAPWLGTWPADLPTWASLTLDHVLVRGLAVCDVQALPITGSDHRAVLATTSLIDRP